MPRKTNAVRLLDQKQIVYSLREYEVDPGDLSAETVAAKIGFAPRQVFKTLLVRGSSGALVMAVIPGDADLDLKALAAAAGERKVQMVPVKDLQALTGYVRGGVTALGARKDFRVFLDEAALQYDQISVSAGLRGLQVLLAPSDYRLLTGAVVARLSRPKA